MPVEIEQNNIKTDRFYLMWAIPVLFGALFGGVQLDTRGRKFPMIVGLAITGVSLAIIGVLGILQGFIAIIPLAIGYSIVTTSSFIIWSDLAPIKSRGLHYGMGFGIIGIALPGIDGAIPVKGFVMVGIQGDVEPESSRQVGIGDERPAEGDHIRHVLLRDLLAFRLEHPDRVLGPHDHHFPLAFIQLCEGRIQDHLPIHQSHPNSADGLCKRYRRNQ